MAALELNPSPDAAVTVVLGASNVSRGLPRLLAAVRARSRAPAKVLVAAGHGRSWGANSRIWMRRLPSILKCGLWQALERDHAAAGEPGGPPLRALVTDVGNDLLYGFAVDQVADWVRESCQRLHGRGASLVITRLPLESIAGVGRGRYRALRTIYVPGCPLSLSGLKEAACRLDDRLQEIARDFRATLIEQPGCWYGIDAMHLRRRHLDQLWHLTCDAWGLEAGARGAPASLADWMAIGSRGAEVRMLAGSLRFTPQPAVRWAEGSTVALY